MVKVFLSWLLVLFYKSSEINLIKDILLIFHKIF